jgi:hypothetical protein
MGEGQTPVIERGSKCEVAAHGPINRQKSRDFLGPVDSGCGLGLSDLHWCQSGVLILACRIYSLTAFVF